LLALILVVAALWLVRFVFIDVHLVNYFPRWIWVTLQFLLSIGPLLFFYVRSIKKPDPKFTRKVPLPSSRDKLIQKGYWLRHQMKAHRFYLDAELSLNSLAKELGISIHELSKIINTGLRKNFNDFVNEFRIQEVVRKMKDPAYDRITLLGIAYDCGFNSKTTFNRAFKEITGKSPAEYKAELKKQRPNHDSELLSGSAAIISGHKTIPEWSCKKLNRNRMFRNYLKIAWRNMLYNKGYSALNIVGLAAGMAVALLIGLWVTDQYSYDHFLPNYKQLYRPFRYSIYKCLKIK
jgi:AraC-like DNA-binding protein